MYKISKLLILDNEKSFSLYLIMFFGERKKEKKSFAIRKTLPENKEYDFAFAFFSLVDIYLFL